MEGRSKEDVVGQLLARATSERDVAASDGKPLRPSASTPAAPRSTGKPGPKARWGRTTATLKATGALGDAPSDGLEVGTRIWVEDTEHPRADQFGVVKELSNKTTVRVLFDDQWDGDKGEVVRRTSIIPSDWRKKKARGTLIGEHTPRTPISERRKGSAKRRDSASSVSSRHSSSEDNAARVSRLQHEIMTLRAQLDSLEAEQTAAAKQNRSHEAVQTQQQIEVAKTELRQKLQELGLTNAVEDPSPNATDVREAAAALIRSKYRDFDRRRKQTALDSLLAKQQQAEQARASLEMQLRVAEETLEDGVQKSMAESKELTEKLLAEDEARCAVERELQCELTAAKAAAAAAKIQSQFRDRRARQSARSVLRSTSAHVRELQAQCAARGELESELAAASAAHIASEEQHVGLSEELSSTLQQLRDAELRELAAQKVTSAAAAGAVEAVERRLEEQNKLAVETARSGMRASVEAEVSKNALLQAEIARLQGKLELAAGANLKQVQEMSMQVATERANAQLHEHAAMKAAASADELRQAKAAVDAELLDAIAEKDRITMSSTAQQKSQDIINRSMQASQDSLKEQLAEALGQKVSLEAQMATAASAYSSAQAEADRRLTEIESQKQDLATALSEMTGAKEAVEADLATSMEELRVNIGAISQMHGSVVAEQELVATTKEAAQRHIKDGEEKLVLAQSAADAAIKLSQAHEEACKRAEERATTANTLVSSLEEQAKLVQSQLDAEKAEREEAQNRLQAEMNQKNEMKAAHVAALEAMKAQQQEIAEAKLDEFHAVLQRELMALTKLHEQEGAKRKDAESAAAKQKAATQALEEELATLQKDSSQSAAEAHEQLAKTKQRYDDERQIIILELEEAKQEERAVAAEAQTRLEAVTQQKQQLEEQYAAMSMAVQSISDTFKTLSETAQSLHDAEIQTLQGTLESESSKVGDEIQQLQASAAEEMQQKLADLEQEHLAARTLLSEQHTAAATIQAQRHRCVARRDVRAVMQAHRGSQGAPSIEDLESQLSTMKSQHEDALSSVEARHATEMDVMAASLVSDAALVAAEERHTSADEQDETVHAINADHEQRLAEMKQRYEAERQILISELEAAREASRVELESLKKREFESVAAVRQLNNQLVVQNTQAEERQQALSATMQSMSETFKKQAETANHLHKAVQSSMSDAAQAAIDKAAADKKVALATLENKVQAVQSARAEQMEEQMDAFVAAETGWQVAVEASIAVTSQQISELEVQNQTLMDELVSTGVANTASIQQLQNELHELAQRHTEAAQEAQQVHAMEIETMASTHTNTVAEIASRVAEAENAHESLASTASRAEQTLRSELDELRRIEADLVARVLTSEGACKAALESTALQSKELQALRFEMELLEDTRRQAVKDAASAVAILSRQHTAAAKIQSQHRRHVAQRDMRAIMEAQRAAIARFVESETSAAEKAVRAHVAAATIQHAHRRRRTQHDIKQLIAQGVRSAKEASAAAQKFGVLNTELHSARVTHSESLQALQKDFDEVLLNVTAQHDADRKQTEQDVRQEMAWLSTKLAESEQAVAAAENQRDTAFLYNQHNSAATMIQRFARTRKHRIIIRALLSQSSQRSTQDRNAIEALNVALMSSSDRLEVAVRQVQTLLTEALSREAQTARLLNEERSLNAALQQEAAATIQETISQISSKLLAEHTALRAQQDNQHYAAATIQRALHQRSAQHAIRALVRASHARLAQEQAENLLGKAIIEETQDKLATANATNESALEQLAVEIHNGRERAAATKIQASHTKLLSSTASSLSVLLLGNLWRRSLLRCMCSVRDTFGCAASSQV